MPWKKGKIRFDDGSTYPAELLVNSNGQVWNARIFKNDNTIEEIDVKKFADNLNKTIEEVYPYTYEIES